jgi:transcriptional regulator with XRE-family HTH domain
MSYIIKSMSSCFRRRFQMPYLIQRCRLKPLLRQIGKSQRWLAEVADISPQKISDYANNRRRMPLEICKTCAEAIGVTIDELFEWREVSYHEWREWKKSRTKE